MLYRNRSHTRLLSCLRIKRIYLYQTTVSPSLPLRNVYSKEKHSLTKSVRGVHVSKIPIGINIISTHASYKVKFLDDGSRLMKARIAPHGNKDRDRTNLKSDSATYPRIGMRIILSIPTIMGWNLSKTDFKSAFLQSGPTVTDLHVAPPKESKDKLAYLLI